jgi:xylulokinase
MTYVLAYDIGTTGVKTCLFSLTDRITLCASTQEGYGLYLLKNGGAEQEPEEWWQAMCRTTRALFSQVEIAPEAVSGVSFCSQMQGLVLVDRGGAPVRRAMSYMDQRAGAELRRGLAHGPQIAGANVYKLLRCLRATGAVPSSVKDPVWKYKWVEAHEPALFARANKWLDVKEYLLLRCTGRAVMTEDSAYATLLYDTRRRGWSEALCRMFGVNTAHLPPIVQSTDQVGGLTEAAAADLGLPAGTPVFAGGGDAALIGVGAGATAVGATHIYCGTSGWVITVTDRQRVDVTAMIAAIAGAQRGRYNYFAEMETAGKCLEWVKDHLALDEIGVYLEKKDVAGSQETVYQSLYDYLTETVGRVPPGAGGVIFTPWLHGNRCPFEDPAAAGMFFNIRLDTGKTELIRAVLEGVCFHLRWMLEAEAKKVPTSDPVRFVGGGALSPVTAQMLADITGRRIETVDSPQNVGSVGAAAVMAVGLGLVPDLDAVGALIPAAAVYQPNGAHRAVYDKSYAVFKKLYAANRAQFRALNG